MSRGIHKDRVQLGGHLQELVVEEVDMTEHRSQAGVNVVAVLFQEEQLEEVELHRLWTYNGNISERACFKIRRGKLLVV